MRSKSRLRGANEEEGLERQSHGIFLLPLLLQKFFSRLSKRQQAGDEVEVSPSRANDGEGLERRFMFGEGAMFFLDLVIAFFSFLLLQKFIKAKPAAKGEAPQMRSFSEACYNNFFSSPFSSCKFFLKAKPAAKGEGRG
jgi:hypothetical protein